MNSVCDKIRRMMTWKAGIGGETGRHLGPRLVQREGWNVKEKKKGPKGSAAKSTLLYTRIGEVIGSYLSGLLVDLSEQIRFRICCDLQLMLPGGSRIICMIYHGGT